MQSMIYGRSEGKSGTGRGTKATAFSSVQNPDILLRTTYSSVLARLQPTAAGRFNVIVTVR